MMNLEHLSPYLLMVAMLSQTPYSHAQTNNNQGDARVTSTLTNQSKVGEISNEEILAALQAIEKAGKAGNQRLNSEMVYKQVSAYNGIIIEYLVASGRLKDFIDYATKTNNFSFILTMASASTQEGLHPIERVAMSPGLKVFCLRTDSKDTFLKPMWTTNPAVLAETIKHFPKNTLIVGTTSDRDLLFLKFISESYVQIGQQLGIKKGADVVFNDIVRYARDFDSIGSRPKSEKEPDHFAEKLQNNGKNLDISELSTTSRILLDSYIRAKHLEIQYPHLLQKAEPANTKQWPLMLFPGHPPYPINTNKLGLFLEGLMMVSPPGKLSDTPENVKNAYIYAAVRRGDNGFKAEQAFTKAWAQNQQLQQKAFSGPEK